MLKTVKRILVIKLRDIGDIVLSTPVLNVLNENCPAPEIVYVLKKEYEYFKYLLPNVKHVITYDRNDPLDFFRVIFKLRRYKFDLAVNLHASFRSALMAFLSGAKFRLVHNHSGRDFFTSVPLNIEEKQKSIIDRDLETLSPLKISVTPEMKKTKLIINDTHIRDIVDDDAQYAAGLGIGAKRANKTWDRDKFVELGRRLADSGYPVAVFCSSSERSAGEYISAGIPNSRLFAGMDFLRVAFFINKLTVFIGNDSGLRHIAAALGKKTVTLFGAENPLEWHPYSEAEGHIAVSHLKDFQAKGVDVLERKFREKSSEPMDMINVDEVLAAAKKLLSGV